MDKNKKVWTIESANSNAGLKKMLSNDGVTYFDSLDFMSNFSDYDNN